jgi:hypothetical protein
MKGLSSLTLGKFAISAITLAVLAACGGGGGTTSTTSTGTTTSTGATVTGTAPSSATGALKSDQTTANELVAAVNKGVATFQTTDALKNAPTAGVVSDLPTGAAVTIDCSLVGASVCTGSYSIDTNITGAIVSGSGMTITYNNVKFTSLASYGDFTYNGTIKLSYDRYVSPSDFAITTTYTNFSFGGTLAGAGTLNGSSTCDIKANVYTCGYNVGDTYVGTYSLSRSGTTTTVSSGLIRANYTGASGYVDCSYANWSYNSTTAITSSGGVVTVTGVNGTVAKITSSGSGRYVVDITVGGTKTTYNVGAV